MTAQEAKRDHILIVDDDQRIRLMLSRYFEEQGFRVSAVANGSAMRKVLAEGPVDVVLLDLMLPGEDGNQLAREIRAHADIGIIIVSGRSDLVDRVVALQVGADDYITKPFELREVLARVRAILRRLPPTAPVPQDTEAKATLGFGGWTLDLERRQLNSPAGQDVPLTTAEFNLLSVFLRHAGRVLTRSQLMDLTRGHVWEAFDRSIDAQVMRPRKKIEPNPKTPTFIKSVQNVGYVWTAGI